VGNPSPGQIVILNGAPRSGKTSIAHALQECGAGVWVNLGVDASTNSLPARLRPGIGLRPGGERPDLEGQVVPLYAARRLEGSSVLVVGVRCPIAVIWERRRESWGQKLENADDQTVAAVERWQSAVHEAFDYDLEVDTTSWSPARCADAIVARLAGPPGTCLAAAGSAYSA
jgi:chloramphenicol 3-O phosphotransferase